MTLVQGVGAVVAAWLVRRIVEWMAFLGRLVHAAPAAAAFAADYFVVANDAVVRMNGVVADNKKC